MVFELIVCRDDVFIYIYLLIIVMTIIRWFIFYSISSFNENSKGKNLRRIHRVKFKCYPLRYMAVLLHRELLTHDLLYNRCMYVYTYYKWRSFFHTRSKLLCLSSNLFEKLRGLKLEHIWIRHIHHCVIFLSLFHVITTVSPPPPLPPFHYLH